MYGENIEIKDILMKAKQIKPACLILGSHHFVQMSEIDFESTGLAKTDLASILWVTPVGASVPPVTSNNIKKLFKNMAVSKFVIFVKIIIIFLKHKTDISKRTLNYISISDVIERVWLK